MLTVTLTHTKDKYKLEMTGHCATAPKGEDLVCAGASALTMAFANVLMQNKDKLKKEPLIETEEGNAKFVWSPLKSYEAALNNSLYTVMVGLQMIQYDNPDSIQFIKK